MAQTQKGDAEVKNPFNNNPPHVFIGHGDKVDPDEDFVRIANKAIREELFRQVDLCVLSEAEKTGRKQLLDRVLACSFRMVGIHDEIHRLGNELRDRNATLTALNGEIMFNQECIDKELKQQSANIDRRDDLVIELENSIQDGKMKDSNIEKVGKSLGVQGDANAQLDGVLRMAVDGNEKIKTTMDTCTKQLNSALD